MTLEELEAEMKREEEQEEKRAEEPICDPCRLLPPVNEPFTGVIPFHRRGGIKIHLMRSECGAVHRMPVEYGPSPDGHLGGVEV